MEATGHASAGALPAGLSYEQALQAPAPGALEAPLDALSRPLDEEVANTATHAAGLVLSLLGAAVLIDAVRGAEGWRTIGCAIYAASMVGVFAASTLSHAVRERRRRRFYRALDQGAIHLAIAGTFTPFALAHLCGGGWWMLLLSMWGTALVGFCAKILWRHRTEAVSIPTYLLLGWMPIAAAEPIVRSVPATAICWILTGGLCYTVGAGFLAFDRRGRYFHAVWHLSVIAGSACHYVVILRYVAAAP